MWIRLKIKDFPLRRVRLKNIRAFSDAVKVHRLTLGWVWQKKLFGARKHVTYTAESYRPLMLVACVLQQERQQVEHFQPVGKKRPGKLFFVFPKIMIKEV